jgi:membrane protein required for colicin V production
MRTLFARRPVLEGNLPGMEFGNAAPRNRGLKKTDRSRQPNVYPARAMFRPMNIFDAAVVGATILAVIMGYRSGLLRSLATIFGYVLATPIAIVATPKLAPLFATQGTPSFGANGLLFAAVFLGVGILTGALLRSAIGLVAGEDISLPDRAAGAALGAVRVGLLAVLMVLIFEQIIPPKQRPGWLVQSQLRPILAAAGEQGVRSLPPDVAAQIDRLKRERGI